MERDALPAGRGSLISSSEIKVLICYILNSINEKIPSTELANLFNYEGIANYFEILDAVESLINSKTIARSEDGECIEILPIGRAVAEGLSSSVPYTIKKKAYRVAAKMVARLRNARETKINVVKENGMTYLECSALDTTHTLMDLKIMVADEIQARTIANRFLDNPSKIYAAIMDIMAGNFDEEDDD